MSNTPGIFHIVQVEFDGVHAGTKLDPEDVQLLCLERNCPVASTCALAEENDKPDQGFVPNLRYEEGWRCNQEATDRVGQVIFKKIELSIEDDDEEAEEVEVIDDDTPSTNGKKDEFYEANDDV